MMVETLLLIVRYLLLIACCTGRVGAAAHKSNARRRRAIRFYSATSPSHKTFSGVSASIPHAAPIPTFPRRGKATSRTKPRLCEILIPLVGSLISWVLCVDPSPGGGSRMGAVVL